MSKKILKVLERDARLSTKQIATMVGKSEKEVEKKIKEMEKAGVIRHYKTVIDWEEAGEERVCALVDVKVSPARDVGFDDIAERVLRFPEVRFLYLVSGLYDFSIMVEGKTMKDVASFISEKLAPVERVQSTITHFILKKYKEEGEVIGKKEVDKRMRVSL
ncbi:MAG: AsnC family transcriptional regulator [Armatimonadetes bacterium CG07_land_8_20_14_0_80_40_9]|nr:MAG: AsnC family transcriptional regulator [Armatimonadetes bacterium CG07_land_8_20_14_0_80_40_9]